MFASLALLSLLGTAIGVDMIVKYHDAHIPPFQVPTDGFVITFYAWPRPPEAFLLFWWYCRVAVWPLTILIPVVTAVLILSDRFVFLAWCAIAFWTVVSGVCGLWLTIFNHLNGVGAM